MKKLASSLTFSCVEPEPITVRALYELLKNRGTSAISHLHLPSYEQHEAFVKNHPYRAWYLIRQNLEIVGSTYLTSDNVLGIFLKEPSTALVKSTLEWVTEKYAPLPELKSLRPSYFYVNVSGENKEMIQILESIGLPLLQHSYRLDKYNQE